MKSRATPQFWKLYRRLPVHIRQQGRKAYHLWKDDPNHPSLRFKSVEDVQHIYSVRVGAGYRALGVLESDTMVWFWIGGHDDYLRILRS
jgi:hypothetical protein